MRILALLLALLAVPSVARAQYRYYYAPYDRNEISLGAGLQLDATGWEPAGMKLFFEYARRIGPHGAVTFQVNPLIVPALDDPGCRDRLTACRGGFYANGYSVDLLFGGKWRWHARGAPLVGTFDLTFGAVPMFGRYFDDNGVAVVGRAGGGLVVMLARHVGLRFDGHLVAGPAFVGYWRCDTCGVVRPYVAFDTGIGVEFVF